MLSGPATGSRVATLDRRLARLRRSRGPAAPAACDRVRDLVVLASSSRGGSSMLAEMLRASDALLHLRGEINPFLRLVGLAYPDGADSDRLGAADLRGLDPSLRRVLDEELALEFGNPARSVGDPRRFGLDLAWRLTVQWPGMDWDPDALAGLAADALERLGATPDAQASAEPDWTRFQLLLLDTLRESGFPLDAALYDTGGPARLDTGPPGVPLVEEPPFVLSRPWRHAREDDLASRPLVVKSPSNAYRLGFLRELFPNARMHVLHLTRNPAASINGLYDGWRYHGFHAHRTPEPLDIEGYTDHRPQDRHWWKFDLPPGWRDYTGAPLLEVCAFQWRASHGEILDGVGGEEYLRIRFEELIGPPAVRADACAKLAAWLQIPFDTAFRRVLREGVAPVSATVPPSPGRGRSRAPVIEKAIDARVRAVAAEVGYDGDEGWI